MHVEHGLAQLVGVFVVVIDMPGEPKREQLGEDPPCAVSD
jgi:hypothetical protein